MSAKGLNDRITKYVKKLVERFIGVFKSGEWFIVIGGFSFIYDLISYGLMTVETAIHEVTQTNLSIALLLDVVILAIGVVIWHMNNAYGNK